MKCHPNAEDLNGALCYPKCTAKEGSVYRGIGPVCHETSEVAPLPGATVAECPGWDCTTPGTTCSAGNGYCCNTKKKWIPGKCR